MKQSKNPDSRKTRAISKKTGNGELKTMNIINVENITKSYTERKLFSKASFYVQEQEKIGIIGINGTGKSTLLKIIAGEEEAEEGTVIRAGHIVINYLPQNPEFDPAKSVLNSVMDGIGEKDSDEVQRWTLESDAKAMLTRLDINDFGQPAGELSGGQRKRLALAAALLKPCDVLILDEPTNHLDYDMVEWLEKYLRGFRGALLMVTHDRYFLDRVCSRIVEIDKGSIYSYETNYSGFLALKAEREESQAASERKRQSILRKEIAWMQRGARARSTKQKAHIQRYEALRDQKGPETTEKLEMSSVSSRLGRTTIEAKGIHKRYGDKVCVADFTYVFLKNDRVGFVGKNGCGKTTLMKMLAGFLKPDRGTIEVGQTVKIGYYCQEIALTTDSAQLEQWKKTKDADTAWMNPDQKVIDYIRDTAEYVRTEDGLVSASAMLDRFLFPPQEQYGLIGKLSGGERRRLNLLRVLMEAPNVLILDEPTNDLDTETLAILEDYLDNYQGIVIAVSHDRYFLDRIVKRIFAFEGNGRICQYEGGYSDYMEKRPKVMENTAGGKVAGSRENSNGTNSGSKKENNAGMTAVPEKKSPGKNGNKKLKFTYKEQKEYETIEADIEKLEETIASLEAQISENASNSAKLMELTAAKDDADEQLLEKMERWEYLEDLAQKIAAQ